MNELPESITVKIPSDGWLRENLAPWRSGRIEMEKTAHATVDVDVDAEIKISVSIVRIPRGGGYHYEIEAARVVEIKEDGEYDTSEYDHKKIALVE